ncbi:MAG: lipoate--protein ligase family protein [Syntrophobacteraceae bacterium]
MRSWRLLDTGALPASLNMAIDEALLQLHVPGESQPVLRFYQWKPPAVSLGYFQKPHSIDLSACRKLGLEVVRRATGGRAVFHENDLTYSIVADSSQGFPSTLDAAYRLLSRGLLAGFKLLGFEAELGHEKVRAPKSDICFVNALVADIVYQGKKFVGSAQTWRGASFLQHGSIVLEPQENTWAQILKTDSDSLESLREKLKSRTLSLQEILGRRIEPPELKEAIEAGMAEVLQIDFQPAPLHPHEWALANEIASAKTVLPEKEK